MKFSRETFYFEIFDILEQGKILFAYGDGEEEEIKDGFS